MVKSPSCLKLLFCSCSLRVCFLFFIFVFLFPLFDSFLLYMYNETGISFIWISCSYCVFVSKHFSTVIGSRGLSKQYSRRCNKSLQWSVLNELNGISWSYALISWNSFHALISFIVKIWINGVCFRTDYYRVYRVYLATFTGERHVYYMVKIID